MNTPRMTYYSRRHFWAWLNVVWNRVDNDRIREVGPELACAEWLMRNGALIKWAGEKAYIKDYDSLSSDEPKINKGKYIEEIDATDSTIMHIGFPHFEGCNHVSRIKFHRCINIEDKALKNLDILKNSLRSLQVSSCGNVSDKGVKYLASLINLKQLILFDLIEVKNIDACTAHLKKALPGLVIELGSIDEEKDAL